MLKKSISFLHILVVVGLVFSLALATPIQVFADDGTTDDPTPEASEAPATDETPVEEPVTDEAPPEEATEEAATEEVAAEEIVDEAPAEAPAEEAPADEVLVEEAETVSELIASLDEAEAVLSSEDGDIVPLASQDALDALTAPDPIGCPAGVKPVSWGGTGTGCTSSYTSIQAAINDISVVDGWTVYIDPGTFSENVTITKAITLQGSGNGDNPATNTIIYASSGNVVGISSDNVTLVNLRIEGGSGAANGIQINTNISDLALQSVTVADTNAGLRIGTAVSLDGLTIDDSHFDDNTYGWYFAQSSSSPAVVKDVNVTNTSFNGNAYKGIYVEKLEDAVFDNIEVINSGTDAVYGYNDGIDINLKYADYANIIIRNSLIQGSGLLGGATNPMNAAAVTIKARDAGSYGSKPATLSNVILDNVTINGGETGLRFGEPHGSGPLQAAISGLTIANSSISGNATYGLVNETQGTINAESNWWGCWEGPGGVGCDTVSGLVDYSPWLTVAPPANDADSDGIADSADNCPAVANHDQANGDDDAEGDVCDPRPNDPTNERPGKEPSTSPDTTGGGFIIPVTGGGFFESGGVSLSTADIDGASIAVTELAISAGAVEAYGVAFSGVTSALQLDIPVADGILPTITLTLTGFADGQIVTVVLPDGTSLDLAVTCTTAEDGTQICTAAYTPDGSEGSLSPIFVVHK